MLLENNKYLAKVKPLLKELLNKLLDRYEYVSILAGDSRSRRYSISKRGIIISDDITFCGRGFVVKIYHEKRYVEYSFNEISSDTIGSLVDSIHEKLIKADETKAEGIIFSEYEVPDDEELVILKSTEYKIHPDDIGDEKLINHLSMLREKGLACDERIMDCSVFSNYQIYGKLFLSRNRDLEQNVMWMTGGVFMMAQKGEELKDSYRGYSCLGGAEILEEMENDINNIASNVLCLLESNPIIPGEYDCICTPDVTGMIVHEAFGHGVEMDMFVKNRAKAAEYIDEYTASPLINMHDGSAVDEAATYFFDDEGVVSNDTLIIEKGILKRGISDMQSAKKLNKTPTGNGRRESFERKAYTRMTNTYFEAGDDKLEDMIKSISYGFLLEEATSGMEDPKNWGIQCMVNIAKEIKDGKLTGNVFSPIVLTGYVPDLLKSISMLSDAVKLSGTGYCGKGYKEWVKVSDGGPYIKAKIRLG